MVINMRRRFMSSNKDDFFYIEALEDVVSYSIGSLTMYKIDEGEDWITLEAGHESESVNTGSRLYIKGNIDNYHSTSTFSISGKCRVGGNIQSLGYGDKYAQIQYTKMNQYNLLFSECTTIVEVAKELLPATTLASSCYEYMFKGCTSLVNAPELPATTLASSCYEYMFKGCTSLVNAPELPATTLASSCYEYMFYGCTSLVNAPELPATTLAYSCYSSMFYDCTSLVNAPELPATTLAEYCYEYMFYGCTSLVNAPELPATTLAYGCYQDMFRNCISLVNAPELPATTLAYSCYSSMFYGCTSLVNAPELPATTLAEYCYFFMFYRCINLKYIKMLAIDISATDCLYNWVYSVSSTGTFVKSKDATWDVVGDSGVPTGWTVITDEQESGGR